MDGWWLGAENEKPERAALAKAEKIYHHKIAASYFFLCCVALSCLGRSVDRSVCYEIVGFSFMRNVRFSRVGPTIFLLLFRFVLVAILFGLRVYVVVLVIVIVGRKVQKFKFLLL